MKPHHSKQNSLEFRVTPSLNNQAYIHNTTQTLARTYRKKTQINDNNPLLFLHNAPSILGRYPNTREHKKSLGKNGEHRSTQKKSQAKLLNERSIERLRVVYKPNQINTLGHKAKIAKMVSILTVKPMGEGKDLLGQVYQANSTFEGLLQEWRRLDIYDDIDDLMAKLVENYTALIEEMALRAYGFANQCINKYEGQISLLQAENQSLRSVLQFQTNKFEVQMMQVENRIYEQFEKSQWGTFIFNQLSKKAFDVQYFVKNSDVYAKAKVEYLSNGLYKCYTRSKVIEKQEAGPQKKEKITFFPDLHHKTEQASMLKLKSLSHFS